MNSNQQKRLRILWNNFLPILFMFFRFIAFLILLSTTYALGVFFVPETMNTYWSKPLNEFLQKLKSQSLQLSSWSVSPDSLFSQISSGAKSLFDETKDTLETVKQTTTEKVEQVKKTTESVQSAYDAVQSAKKDIENLTRLTGSTQK